MITAPFSAAGPREGSTSLPVWSPRCWVWGGSHRCPECDDGLNRQGGNAHDFHCCDGRGLQWGGLPRKLAATLYCPRRVDNSRRHLQSWLHRRWYHPSRSYGASRSTSVFFVVTGFAILSPMRKGRSGSEGPYGGFRRGVRPGRCRWSHGAACVVSLPHLRTIFSFPMSCLLCLWLTAKPDDSSRDHAPITWAGGEVINVIVPVT
jgi:hypothetical protein